ARCARAARTGRRTRSRRRSSRPDRGGPRSEVDAGPSPAGSKRHAAFVTGSRAKIARDPRRSAVERHIPAPPEAEPPCQKPLGCPGTFCAPGWLAMRTARRRDTALLIAILLAGCTKGPSPVTPTGPEPPGVAILLHGSAFDATSRDAVVQLVHE